MQVFRNPIAIARVLSLCVGLAACAAARAEYVEVTLKNGQAVTGELVSHSDEKTVIRIFLAGVPTELSFDAADVVIFHRDVDPPGTPPSSPDDAPPRSLPATPQTPMEAEPSPDSASAPSLAHKPDPSPFDELSDPELFAKADAGDADAQAYAAQRLLKTGKSDAECERAMRWLSRAAERNSREALFQLAERARSGDCAGAVDAIQALRYYERAAKLGHRGAMLGFVEMLLPPGSSKRNATQAVPWLRKLVKEREVRAHALLHRADPALYRKMCVDHRGMFQETDIGRAVRYTAEVQLRGQWSILLFRPGSELIHVEATPTDFPEAMPGRLVTMSGPITGNHRMQGVAAEVLEPEYKFKYEVSKGCGNLASGSRSWSVSIDTACTKPQAIKSVTYEVRCWQQSGKARGDPERDQTQTVVAQLWPARSDTSIVNFSFIATEDRESMEQPKVTVRVVSMDW